MTGLEWVLFAQLLILGFIIGLIIRDASKL